MSVIVGNDPTRDASFTLRNRLGRVLWSVVYVLLFRPSPRPFHGWRAALLRLFGARLGPHVHVYPSVRIWAPWNLEAEGHVGVGDGAILYNMAPIRIGYRAVISQRAHLCAGSHDPDSANFQLVVAPIEIGAHTWVCAEAFVAMGVRTAEGVVIGARSVLTRSPDRPWTIYAGNPARPIRARRRTAGPAACAEPS